MLADYATGRADRNLKRAERCATGGSGRSWAAARGRGECRAGKEGVDAGGRDRRLAYPIPTRVIISSKRGSPRSES